MKIEYRAVSRVNLRHTFWMNTIVKAAILLVLIDYNQYQVIIKLTCGVFSINIDMALISLLTLPDENALYVGAKTT